MVDYAVITGQLRTVLLLAWLVTYFAFAAAAAGSALQWRHRMRALRGLEGHAG